MINGTIRRRYHVAVSAGYIALGIFIAVRSILADVLPIVLLGLVFIALGGVRLRDYLNWRRNFSGS